ncbi:hypothetical protein [Caulobacter phage Cr30]|nr:hypothetical protein OZ74_gp170 [Caulobacter phage Cr30]AGS81055.1 hypothetical protein [Caulobacter phage Cr30]
MIASVNAFICSECVDLCMEIVQERRKNLDPYRWYDPISGEF